LILSVSCSIVDILLLFDAKSTLNISTVLLSCTSSVFPFCSISVDMFVMVVFFSLTLFFSVSISCLYFCISWFIFSCSLFSPFFLSSKFLFCWCICVALFLLRFVSTSLYFSAWSLSFLSSLSLALLSDSSMSASFSFVSTFSSSLSAFFFLSS